MPQKTVKEVVQNQFTGKIAVESSLTYTPAGDTVVAATP